MLGLTYHSRYLVVRKNFFLAFQSKKKSSVLLKYFSYKKPDVIAVISPTDFQSPEVFVKRGQSGVSGHFSKIATFFRAHTGVYVRNVLTNFYKDSKND